MRFKWGKKAYFPKSGDYGERPVNPSFYSSSFHSSVDILSHLSLAFIEYYRIFDRAQSRGSQLESWRLSLLDIRAPGRESDADLGVLTGPLSGSTQKHVLCESVSV